MCRKAEWKPIGVASCTRSRTLSLKRARAAARAASRVASRSRNGVALVVFVFVYA